MNEKYLAAKESLRKFGQEHVLNHYDKLSYDYQNKLLDQILTIDFNQINQLYEQTKKEINLSKDIIEPIAYVEKAKLSEKDLNKYKELGKTAIKNGKYAVVTMAGGQGTRLGHNGPKGTFDIGLQLQKSIFELLIDKLKQDSKKYGRTIPWYIMTSKENNVQTQEFFKKNNFFGYDKTYIMFFMQGELPMCNKQGKVLITEEGLIKEAADGHGGIFESLRRNAIIYDMENKGIEWVFIGPVDNVLVKMVDPILLGLSIDRKVLAGGKSVIKSGPEEKVGVFCKRNGKPGVIEYTEITKEMAERKNSQGELVFAESHINCNLFNIKAIKEVSTRKLPYHSAFKKAEYMDEQGKIIKPKDPNAYKFESFIFDAFDMLDDMAILRVKREEEFAPVKNAQGVDSPETARKLYQEYYNII